MKRNSNWSMIMWREKLVWQQSEFNTQRQHLSSSRKISDIPKMRNWHPESQKHHLKRCWMLSETVWVIFKGPTVKRKGMMRKMMNRQSWASWAKMTNRALWWAQSPQWYSAAWRDFNRTRWALTNWHNRDGGMRSTSFMNKIKSKGQRNWTFLQSWSPKMRNLWPHLHWYHLESVWRLFISCAEYCKCSQGHLAQEVVKQSLVSGHHSRTNAQWRSHLTWNLVCHQSCKWRLLIL